MTNPYFKDPNGDIKDYGETVGTIDYSVPYYSTDQKESISEEARKFILGSNDDLSRVRRMLKPLNRVPVQVWLFLKLSTSSLYFVFFPF